MRNWLVAFIASRPVWVLARFDFCPGGSCQHPDGVGGRQCVEHRDRGQIDLHRDGVGPGTRPRPGRSPGRAPHPGAVRSAVLRRCWTPAARAPARSPTPSRGPTRPRPATAATRNYSPNTGSDSTADVGAATSTIKVSDNAVERRDRGHLHLHRDGVGPGTDPDRHGHLVGAPGPAAVRSAVLRRCWTPAARAPARSPTPWRGPTRPRPATAATATTTPRRARTLQPPWPRLPRRPRVADDAAGVVYKGTFTFTVTVSGPGGTPTGTVTWSVTRTRGRSDQLRLRRCWTASGKGTCTITDAIAGTYSARPATRATATTTARRVRTRPPPWAGPRRRRRPSQTLPRAALLRRRLRGHGDRNERRRHQVRHLQLERRLHRLGLSDRHATSAWAPAR